MTKLACLAACLVARSPSAGDHVPREPVAGETRDMIPLTSLCQRDHPALATAWLAGLS